MFCISTFDSLVGTRPMVGQDVCDPDLPSFTTLFFRIYFTKSINLHQLFKKAILIVHMPTFLKWKKVILTWTFYMTFSCRFPSIVLHFHWYMEKMISKIRIKEKNKTIWLVLI